jgi:FixJ family two-component response regulator
VSAAPLVAIIDDDESLRLALVGLVRSEGLDAKGFPSAEDFLGSGAAVACVITDIQMPGMSGIDLKEALAARQCSVPVIMITARSEPGLEERARASGAACYLKKPFEASELLGCIAKALRG